jgi:dUTP pyrophosphatase
MIRIRIRKLHENAVTPHYAHEGDAGMDLYASEDCILAPGERRLIPVGFQVEMPEGYELQIRPKSGLALKHGITVLNTPGTVDSCYRGEVGVILHNASGRDFEVRTGEKVAQAVVARVETAIVEEAGDLSETERGKGGFGSTGRGPSGVNAEDTQ